MRCRGFARCPTVAYRLSAKKSDPLEVYLEDSLTVMANMAGIPSISVPCGAGEGGMPVGIQIIGAELSEEKLYRIGAVLEGVYDGI